MGTMIQQPQFNTKKIFAENDLKIIRTILKGNNDLLSITQPEIIKEIHRAYFEAGADIVETNTFNANSNFPGRLSAEHLAYEINFEAAKIAKEVADEFNRKENPKTSFCCWCT